MRLTAPAKTRNSGAPGAWAARALARHLDLNLGRNSDRMRNLITDVPGVAVGHAQDAQLASGATAIVFDRPAVASVDVRGGAPGTRESDLLDPGMLVDQI